MDYWERMVPVLKHKNSKIKKLIGEVDADAEWQNPKLSAHEFYDSRSYNNFTEDDILFLYGRRGTGKTAFIRMFDHDIRNGEVKRIIGSKIIDKQKSYDHLTSSVRGSPIADYPMNELVSILADKWKWIITTSAMIALYESLNKESGKQAQEIKILHDFLKGQNMLSSKNGFSDPSDPIERVTNTLASNLAEIEYSSIKTGLALSKTIKQLKTPEYQEALRVFNSILNSRKKYVCVLIDSMEVYDLNDKIGSSAISALIRAALHYYNHKESERILVKVAFQIEIYNQIHQLNPGKSLTRELIILWRYKELLCLLAKRFQARINDFQFSFTCSLNNYRNALNFLYKHLPQYVVSQQGVKFDTLAYIVRHTQKKPRHMIVMTNVILTIAEYLKIDDRPLPQDFIRAAVHTNLNIIFEESFSIYDHIYLGGKQGAEKLIKRVLTEMPHRFYLNELDKSIGDASSLREEYGISRESMRRLLLESGAIGQINKISPKSLGGKDFIEATFEYQIKGELDANYRSEYVIHPMLYQDYKIEVNFKDYVYPMAYESEEIEVLQEMGYPVAPLEWR